MVHQSKGLGKKIFDLLNLRFEWQDKFTFVYAKVLLLPLDRRFEKFALKIINRYLAFFTSINHNLIDLMALNVLRTYLIRSFHGRAYFLHKPSYGQRTRSNAKSAARSNVLLTDHFKIFKKQLKLQLRSAPKVTYFKGKRVEIKKQTSLRRKPLRVPLKSFHIQTWF